MQIATSWIRDGPTRRSASSMRSTMQQVDGSGRAGRRAAPVGVEQTDHPLPTRSMPTDIGSPGASQESSTIPSSIPWWIRRMSQCMPSAGSRRRSDAATSFTTSSSPCRRPDMSRALEAPRSMAACTTSGRRSLLTTDPKSSSAYFSQAQAPIPSPCPLGARPLAAGVPGTA